MPCFFLLTLFLSSPYLTNKSATQDKAEMGISSDFGIDGSWRRYSVEDDSASSKDHELQQDLPHSPVQQEGNDGHFYIFGSHASIQIPEITNCRITDTEVSTSAAPAGLPNHISVKRGSENAHQYIKRNCATGGHNSSPMPVTIKFEDIKFQVQSNVEESWNPKKAISQVNHSHQCSHRQILKGVTGVVVPGEILAIMGPSGSGKTSLLRILSSRLHNGVKGNVTYNDITYNTALKRRIGFVTQDDLLFPQLTVKETLMFAAQLRLPRSMTFEEKILRAETVLKDLGLERCQETRVGGVFVPGVSGGERKRTSIGYELLVDPSLLFLDEPTSGLDSSTALRLLQVLQKNAKIGRTVIMTIHQPSSRLFHMFDKLILLSEGHPIYYGKARDAMQYFASHHYTPQLVMNPADFLLDLATGKVEGITLPDDLRNALASRKMEHTKRTDHPSWILERVDGSLADNSLDSEDSEFNPSKEVTKALQSKYRAELEPVEKKRLLLMGKAPDHLQVAMQVKRDWSSSWMTQFVVLSKRTFRERVRDYMDFLRLFQAIGVSILLGLLWLRSKVENEAQLRDQVGLIFYICIFWSTSSIYAAVYNFPLEQFFLAKERAADMYRLSAYYISSTLCDMPAQLAYPTIFMTIVYFMAGFHRTVFAFLMTLLSVYLIIITGQGVGEFFGAVVLDIKKAGTIVSLILLIFLLTGGYYVQRIPVFIRWLKYISFVYYGFHLLLKVQYSADESYDCSERGGCVSIETSPSFEGIALGGGAMEAGILLAMAVGYRALAYVFLRKQIKLGT